MLSQMSRPHPQRGSFLYMFRIFVIIVMMIYRFTIGYSPILPYSKQPTDSSFWHDATKQWDPREHVSKHWGYLAWYKKMLIRWSIVVEFILIPFTFLGGALLAVVPALVIPSTGASIIAVLSIRKYRHRFIFRDYINPIAMSTGHILKMNPEAGQKWIHVPPSIAKKKKDKLLDKVALPSWFPSFIAVLKVIRAVKSFTATKISQYHQLRDHLEKKSDAAWIRYSPSLTVNKGIRADIETIIPMKLGGDDWIINWHGKGRKPYILIKPMPHPPELVTFSDIKHLLTEASEAAPILGLTATEPLSVNIDTEAPHLGISCGSGAGKSILVRGAIAQWLHWGTQVILLDGKRLSQSWCKDLPGIEYYRSGEEMHNVLVEICNEMERRFSLFDSVLAEDEHLVDVGPRIVVLFEEQNIGMQMLREYWREIKEPRDLNVSPAQRAYVKLTQGGRQAKIHLVSVAQYFNQDSCVTTAARANYGPRILGRADSQAWMMLARDCLPFPKTTKRRGRMHLVFEGVATEFQGALWTVAEARNWAASGPVTVPVSWREAPDLRDSRVTVTPGSEEPVRPTERLLALFEVAEQDWCSVSYDALRQRKKRGQLPASIKISGQDKYRESEIKNAILASVEVK